jgi:hypothetical protein
MLHYYIDLFLVPSLLSRLSEAKVQGHLEKPLWKVELKDAIVAGGSPSEGRS